MSGRAAVAEVTEIERSRGGSGRQNVISNLANRGCSGVEVALFVCSGAALVLVVLLWCCADVVFGVLRR